MENTLIRNENGSHSYKLTFADVQSIPEPPQPIAFEIIDTHNGNKVVGVCKTARAARNSVDRRDNEYGGYRFSVRRVYPQ